MIYPKKELEAMAEEVWEEQQTKRFTPFNLEDYVADLGMPMHPIDFLKSVSSRDVAYFRGVAKDKLSAYTVMFGFQERVIFYNDVHHPNRRRSDIAHEVAHALLMHEPSPPLTSDGQRNFDKGIEGQADYLGAALLIPRSQAINSAFSDYSNAEIAEIFEVSEQLALWRMNSTAARTIVARARKKRTR